MKSTISQEAEQTASEQEVASESKRKSGKWIERDTGNSRKGLFVWWSFLVWGGKREALSGLLVKKEGQLTTFFFFLSF